MTPHDAHGKLDHCTNELVARKSLQQDWRYRYTRTSQSSRLVTGSQAHSSSRTLYITKQFRLPSSTLWRMANHKKSKFAWRSPLPRSPLRKHHFSGETRSACDSWSSLPLPIEIRVSNYLFCRERWSCPRAIIGCVRI